MAQSSAFSVGGSKLKVGLVRLQIAVQVGFEQPGFGRCFAESTDVPIAVGRVADRPLPKAVVVDQLVLTVERGTEPEAMNPVPDVSMEYPAPAELTDQRPPW